MARRNTLLGGLYALPILADGSLPRRSAVSSANSKGRSLEAPSRRLVLRSDSALIVVYSGYASDEKGDFNYLLGARVSSVDNLPAGITYRKLAPGPYAVFITDEGPLVDVLQAEWKKIWAMPQEQMGGKRAFLTDYEVYDQRSADQSHAQIEIHIGLNPSSR